MILIFANHYDYAAQQFVHQWKQTNSVIPIHLVSARQLVYHLKVSHWVDNGKAGFTLVSINGQKIHSCQIDLIINRLMHIPLHPGNDKSYIYQEWLALYNSMLFSVSCPVVNQPDIYTFSGNSLGHGEVKYHLNHAGFTTTNDFKIDWHQTDVHTEQTAFYLLGKSNTKNLELQRKLSHLSKLLDKELFEITYKREKNNLQVTRLRLMPLLHPHIDLFSRHLEKTCASVHA